MMVNGADKAHQSGGKLPRWCRWPCIDCAIRVAWLGNAAADAAEEAIRTGTLDARKGLRPMGLALLAWAMMIAAGLRLVARDLWTDRPARCQRSGMEKR